MEWLCDVIDRGALAKGLDMPRLCALLDQLHELLHAYCRKSTCTL
jgi:hypothetical protein